MQYYFPLSSSSTANKFSGVYCIHNARNDRRYVGKACQSIGNRLKGHLNLMLKGNHYSKLMQADFDQQGEDVFFCEVLEMIPRQTQASEFLFDALEYFWIDLLNPEYNTLKNGLLRCRFKERLRIARRTRRELHQEIGALSKRVQICTQKLASTNQEIELLTHWLEKRQALMQP